MYGRRWSAARISVAQAPLCLQLLPALHVAHALAILLAQVTVHAVVPRTVDADLDSWEYAQPRLLTAYNLTSGSGGSIR